LSTNSNRNDLKSGWAWAWAWAVLGGLLGGLGKSDCCELETKVNCNKSFVIDKRTTNKTPLQLSAVVVVCRTEARPTGWDVVSGWLEWVVVRGG